MSGGFQLGLKTSCRSCGFRKLVRTVYSVTISEPACWAGGESNAVLVAVYSPPCFAAVEWLEGWVAESAVSGECVLNAIPFLAGGFSRAIPPVFPCSLSVTRLVLCLRPAGAARLCFSGSFHNKSPAHTSRGFGPCGRDFLRPLPEKRRLPLGAGHPRVASRMGVPSDIRAKTNTEETTMALYENTIRLKGFIGKDAETKATANGNTFTVFSLATKSSYKDKQSGDWISHTEWHRIISFGTAAKYAQQLQKGDYAEVEGELRSSEYEAEIGTGKTQQSSKRRSWEVRASIVRKLERTGPAESETISEDDAV